MNYQDRVLPILRETRSLLMSGWGNAAVTHQKTESAVSVTTKLDVELEQIVSAKLKAAYPDIEFVGEEMNGNRLAQRFWLMDPIDGTGIFIRGLPFCTTMLALIEEGQVIFSVIYDFINDIAYWAHKGQGAFRDKERLQVSNRSLRQAYTSWETHLDKDENKPIFYALRNRTALFKTLTAGWELAMIASGKLDARVTFDPYGSDYDFAPGALLVAEAGGVVANLGSKEYDYRNVNFIAANPIIYKELTEGLDAIFPLV